MTNGLKVNLAVFNKYNHKVDIDVVSDETMDYIESRGMYAGGGYNYLKVLDSEEFNQLFNHQPGQEGLYKQKDRNGINISLVIYKLDEDIDVKQEMNDLLDFLENNGYIVEGF